MAFLVPVGDDELYLVTVIELEPPPVDMSPEDPTPPPPLLDMLILPPETPAEPDPYSEIPYPAIRSPPVAEEELPAVPTEVEMLELFTFELELLTIELLIGPAVKLSSRAAPEVEDREPSYASTTDPPPELLVPELPDEEAEEIHKNTSNNMAINV